MRVYYTPISTIVVPTIVAILKLMTNCMIIKRIIIIDKLKVISVVSFPCQIVKPKLTSLILSVCQQQKIFALPGSGLNLEVLSFTERVVGYQQGVVESV